MLARAWGIARSLVIYHGQPAKHRRAVRLYGGFLGPGDLAFDIGAHVNKCRPTCICQTRPTLCVSAPATHMASI